LIALQEVALPENNARWLADQLGGYSVYLCPKTGNKHDKEGIAILSRLPIEREATLDLKSKPCSSICAGQSRELSPDFCERAPLLVAG
jgi:hypothetical protein